MPSLNDLNHRNRLLHGQPPPFNTSSPYSNNNNSNPAANYYFPSDESLFNIDSFFDDFVEIDTSDIFDSAEYINIGGGPGGARSSNSSSSKTLPKANNSSLLLPDILQQDELLLKTQIGFSEVDDLLCEGNLSSNQTLDSSGDSMTLKDLPPLVRVPAVTSSVLDQQQPSSSSGGHSIQHHPAEPLKSKKLRCAQCNRKLGVIMIMKCHCEKIFCAQHRYAEAHNCSYDFKLEGKKLLERENPLIVAQKLPKI